MITGRKISFIFHYILKKKLYRINTLIAVHQSLSIPFMGKQIIRGPGVARAVLQTPLGRHQKKMFIFWTLSKSGLDPPPPSFWTL